MKVGKEGHNGWQPYLGFDRDWGKRSGAGDLIAIVVGGELDWYVKKPALWRINGAAASTILRVSR
jgi:hypothetical protein